MLRNLIVSFDPRRRRNRQLYLAFHMALIAIGVFAMVLYGIVGFVLLPALGIEFELPEFRGTIWLEGLTWIVSVVMTLVSLAVMAQRCHDIGWPGWLALIVLIPYLGTVFWLVLFFVPGMKGPNRYGPDPREAHEPA